MFEQAETGSPQLLPTVYNNSVASDTFLNEITIVDRSIIDQNKIQIIQGFLYGNSTYSVIYYVINV